VNYRKPFPPAKAEVNMPIVVWFYPNQHAEFNILGQVFQRTCAKEIYMCAVELHSLKIIFKYVIRL